MRLLKQENPSLGRCVEEWNPSENGTCENIKLCGCLVQQFGGSLQNLNIKRLKCSGPKEGHMPCESIEWHQTVHIKVVNLLL